jgi:hypothetical protein
MVKLEQTQNPSTSRFAASMRWITEAVEARVAKRTGDDRDDCASIEYYFNIAGRLLPSGAFKDEE